MVTIGVLGCLFLSGLWFGVGYHSGMRSPVCEDFRQIWRIENHGPRRHLEIGTGEYIVSYDSTARPGMYVCLDGQAIEGGLN